MPLAFGGDDATRLTALLDLSEENLRALAWLSLIHISMCIRDRLVKEHQVVVLNAGDDLHDIGHVLSLIHI